MDVVHFHYTDILRVWRKFRTLQNIEDRYWEGVLRGEKSRPMSKIVKEQSIVA